jgi:hypothetical protein
MTTQWLRSTTLLQYKIGLNVQELNTIWGYIRDPLIQHYVDRHSYEPSIYPYESILLTLYWLRIYPPERVLAEEYDITQPTVRECIQHVMTTLSSHFIQHYLDSNLVPTQRTKIVGDQYCYGALDSTFIAIKQPEQKQDRNRYYHIKSSTSYAIKFQLAVDMNGFIWDVSNAVVGSTADITLFHTSDIDNKVSVNKKLLADKGYAGDNRLITPYKKPRNRELSDDEKKYNNAISAHRAIVENAIHILKQWAILGTVYRGDINDLAQCTMVIRSIAALYNLRYPRIRLRAH